MGSAYPRNRPALTEPVPVPDIFCNSIEIEEHSNYVRILCAAERAALEGGFVGDSMERPVVARLVIPRCAWLRMIRQCMTVTGLCPEGDKWPEEFERAGVHH